MWSNCLYCSCGQTPFSVLLVGKFRFRSKKKKTMLKVLYHHANAMQQKDLLIYITLIRATQVLSPLYVY